ncbi:translation initiation factor IF-3, C-terminal domain-containing protein [Aspergillus egyptiacus]|nr:translation initiation factor IF-3, C-terminal domain-containing protein [Aspergillus egyptiacus]
MKHVRGLVSTTQALRHVFLVPQTIPRTQPFYSRTIRQWPQLRFLYSTGSRARSIAQAPAKNQQIVNENISADYVQVVGEDNKLGPPEKLSRVLRSFDRSENFLLQVSPGTDDRPPVCKIINRFAAREQERLQAKAAHAAKTSTKQIELNWAIDPHDLAHRLKQLTNFLDKGRKVEIVLTRKKHKRAPTVEEIKNVMDKVLQTTKDANAMQIKPMEGVPGKQVVLVVKKKDT